MDVVIETAIAHGVALEVNSQPHRMDLDGEWVKKVVDQGGLITISSDAHTAGQLDLRQYGVMMARRGWAESSNVLNALPLEDVLERIQRRIRQASRRKAPVPPPDAGRSP
jgi:DNA polymerase (family 10)